MLTTLPTVPGVQSGEVVGLDGKVWPMLCGDCCTLWVSSQYMAGVQLDLAGVGAGGLGLSMLLGQEQER